jgi:type I restriction enzyme M protein
MLRIRELQREWNLKGDDEESRAELFALEQYLALVEREAKASKKVREAVAALERKVAEKYGELSEAEVKQLVIDDKWMKTLDDAVRAELERIAQNLTGRIKTLAERYETPLPQLAAAAEKLAEKVEAHLDRMGFAFELQSIAAKVE